LKCTLRYSRSFISILKEILLEKLITIKTLDDLQTLRDYLEDQEYVAFDTETTGTDKESKIIGFSVSADPELSFYVIQSYWDIIQSQLVEIVPIQDIKAFMELLKGKKLIMHNSVFDCSMVENNYQVSLMPSVYADTMILGHILDENRSNALKELGASLFGEDARKEQTEMKASVLANGGHLTKDKYELYKADSELLAKYGAKDALLTLKLFWVFIEQLYEEKLDKFFFEESMPLLKGPTYQMNTAGLRVDPARLQELKGQLEAEIHEAKAFIYKEIEPLVKSKYKGTKPSNTFNIGSSKQLAWLLFFELGNEFNILTDSGKELCKALSLKLPYSAKAKREFIQTVISNKDRVYAEAKWNPKTRKLGRPKKVGDPWNYLAAGKVTLAKLAPRYKWVERLLQYAKDLKLLNTYVLGIQSRMRYNVIRPSFLQHGTTSGRYSSKNPNFQNLPRKDKRVKNCIIARQGKIFVGADYSQLEPRVFASFSGDKRLLDCFKNGDDFYSVIGMEVFDKYDCSLKKEDPNSFAVKYPDLRDIAKTVALSSTYGTTANKMATAINKNIDESQMIIDSYFSKFPKVKTFMLKSHEQAKAQGRVENLFGRPRRMPQALAIPEIYGDTEHERLPYEIRNILNLAVNHKVQSTGASIMNRAAIAVYNRLSHLGVSLVLQVHDELILEGPEALEGLMKETLKDCMENTVKLPGVDLVAEPKSAKSLADLK